MSRHTYHRSDGNQKQIVKDLRKVGVKVHSLSSVGGCPDLLCEYRGRLTLLEVKMPKGDLDESQKLFAQTWENVSVVHNSDEALKAIGVL